MGEMQVDFLDSYRKFFDRFTLTVDLSDQLPVKVAGYNLIEPEIAGAVADWALQYLEQRKCPPFLIAHLVRKVVEEVRVLSKIDPISCGFRGEIGDFLSLKLMHVCINKLVEVCARYRDNAELSTLPPPYPLPPVTSCAIKNSRRSMEDRHVVIHDFHSLFNIKGYGPASYYGVFDGHNGVDAAIYSVSHLHQYLAESPHYPTKPVLALRDACIKTDDLFSVKAQRENLHGGTTAVFALLRPKDRKLYVAWLGDSQAVLVRRGVPLQIVTPHKPDRSDERDRIQGLGGTVLYWGAWRVNGQLAVSRAIGDVEYKPYVTAEPDVEEITLDGTEDFLILACDGLWDFVTEQDATNAVYNQLQENPEDLESVSQRLVALSKEQSSQDNISVVVVFLAEPSEVAKRRLMETASPSPFVNQNGSDLYCGRPANGQHRGAGFDDSEDFGPETDVDMVDDVLLSPAIAAAKALVHGQKELEDDLERQRQQLSDFDDPADLDRSRDTPTPPAHEVASNSNADNLAESGGEDSEEEWNYIPGKDSKPESDTKEQDDDMSSQLNPNAAEFVPVSPTKLMMLDDAIISASPGLGFEKSMDDIQLPTESEFDSEIAQRPGDLEISNGPKQEDDYFMRDNFSTLRNKGNDFNVSSTCAELGDDSVRSFTSSLNNSAAHPFDDTPFDKLEAVQKIEEKVTSGVFEKANIFGTNNDFSNNAFGATNIFGKSDLMTSSIMGLASSPELEDSAIPGTPKSTIVEAPMSPTNEGVPTFSRQIDLDSPADEVLANIQKSPELISPGDGPCLISGQERTSSSGFESESGAEEGESNVPEESGDGFTTEHRRSPPIDLSFKPIQTFSDTNPFGALQSPFSTTSVDQADLNTEIKNKISEEHLGTNKEEGVFEDKPVIDDMNSLLNSTPSSFILARRSSIDEEQVPFDKLESPEDIPHFEQPPNANSSCLAAELRLSHEHLNSFEEHLSSIKQETKKSKSGMEETSFTTDSVHEKEDTHVLSHADLDSTEGFLVEENKILQDEKECEQFSKLNEEINIDSPRLCQSEQNDFASSEFNPKAVEQVLAAFDEIKDEDDEVECKPELHEVSREPNFEHETKEMKLELESHIIDSKSTPDDLKNIDDTFEVISKDELADNHNTLNVDSEVKDHDLISSGQDNTGNHQIGSKEVDISSPGDENISDIHSELKEKEFDLPKQTETCENNFDSQVSSTSQENVGLLESPTKQTNPFAISDNLITPESLLRHEENRSEETKIELSVKDDLFSAVDSFNSFLKESMVDSDNSALKEAMVNSDNSIPLSSVELSSPVEPQATKTVLYQTLTPADEPKLTKSEIYVTGVKEEEAAKSLVPEEIVPVPDELVHDKHKLDEAKKAEACLLEDVVNTEETKHVVETATDPTETKIQVGDEPVLLKSDPVQSQVVTETLITALEETSEVPSLATTEVPSSAGTPPPTPALESNDDSPKTDILVAAVAAAGAVAAGSAIIADKEVKKMATGPAKKTLVGVTKKPDPTAKAPAKTAPVKTAPTAKPLSTKTSTTTKPAGTATKPTGTVSGSKSGTATKVAAAPGAIKKATASTTLTAAKPASTAASKVGSGTNPKQVPKQLPVNKTSTSALKPSSKPTTPTSKPTTPTTPKSPMVSKTDVKSPPRPAARSLLSSAKPASPSSKPVGAAGEKSAERKSLTNGDIKPLAKKADVTAKKPVTATTKSSTTTTRPATAPVGKPSSTVKTTTSTVAKTTTTKTTTTTQPKLKPTTTATKSVAPVPTKRPASAPATKATDKTGKDTVNKQISSSKPAVNGKTLPSKQTDVKKTDAKVNGKNPTGKPAPIKKPEGIKKEVDNPSKIQEDNVTTTNGFAEHIIEEHESMKVEELVPVIVDGVN